MAKSLKKNYLYSLAYQILTLLTPFVTTPYVSRVLGAEGIGVASYVSAVVFYFTLIASLGTGTFGQREVAYWHDDIKRRSIAFWNAEALNFLASCVAGLAYGLFIIFQTDNQIYYRILLLNIFTIAVDVVWFFQGMEEFQKIVIRNIIFKFVGISYLFLFVKTSDDVDIYLLGNSLTAFISAIFLWGYLPAYIKRISFKDIDFKKTFHQSLLLFIPTFAVSVYVVLDKIMLGYFAADYAENGYYEQGMKIVKMSLMAIFSLSSVMTPRISYCFAKHDWTILRRYMYKSYRLLWLISLPLCFGVWGIADEFVIWFFGDGFAPVTNVLYILALLIPVQGLTIVSGGQFLVSVKKEKYFTHSVIMGAIINILFNFIFIPKLFAVGAAIASILGEIGVAVVQLYYIRKYLQVKQIFNTIYPYLLSALLMYMALMTENYFLMGGAICTGINIVTGVLIYIGGLVALNDAVVKEYIKELTLKVRR